MIKIGAGRRAAEGGGEKKNENREQNKTPHKCESIGHRPLQGGCPKCEANEKVEGREFGAIKNGRKWVGARFE